MTCQVFSRGGGWRRRGGACYNHPHFAEGDRTMLLVGRHRARTCQGITRRALLQVGASCVLGLSLPELLRQRDAASASSSAGAVRSVMLLWLWGGPAQLDTWDPKPNA